MGKKSLTSIDGYSRIIKKILVAKQENRKLSESKNYQNQRIKVAKIHEKIMNMRTDFLNKLSTYIIKKHNIICIEHLSTKGLLRTHKLAKYITDVSWASFVNKLEYKAKWYGKEIIKLIDYIRQIKYALYVEVMMVRKLLI